MLGVIASHPGMLIAMWVALVAVGVDILVRLINSLRGSLDAEQLAVAVTRPVLTDLFPLILLSVLSALRGTHLYILIWFYVAVVLIVIRVLVRLAKALRR
ncbi:MAG: hypothetical protein K6T78_06750 [Alicyclobacillus sp.]|nr:hypothetical protein [Alicyclobacillus sp.]